LTGFCFASPEIQNGHPAEAAAKTGRHGTEWAVMMPPVSIHADVSKLFAKSATAANPKRDEIMAIISAERIALRLPILMNTINRRLRENSRKEAGFQEGAIGFSLLIKAGISCADEKSDKNVWTWH